MKLRNTIILTLIVLSASAFTYQNYVVNTNTTKNIEDASEESWTDLETAIKKSKSDNKRILVDIYTDWCKWCKVMDQKTFSDPVMAEYLDKNFNLAKFNAEQKDPIQFNGKNFVYKKNGKRGFHELAAEMLDGQLAYPSLVVFDAQLNKIEVIRGFKSPQELKEMLAYRANTE